MANLHQNVRQIYSRNGPCKQTQLGGNFQYHRKTGRIGATIFKQTVSAGEIDLNHKTLTHKHPKQLIFNKKIYNNITELYEANLGNYSEIEKTENVELVKKHIKKLVKTKVIEPVNALDRVVINPANIIKNGSKVRFILHSEINALYAKPACKMYNIVKNLDMLLHVDAMVKNDMTSCFYG